ncbi:hypothetical protein APY94_00045 [Thermococcus celericrescens]|uniref:Uncharacterized protein n=2 Tax=Thermococcus celericrescens TaxID=227598 RepID=A0A100XZV6_9EURY|nr:hypothetical protein APY94_00045 [Thermococcus celericrescens]
MEEFIEAGKVERLVGEEVLGSIKFFESYLFELAGNYAVVLSPLGLEVLSTLALERSENSD